MVIEFGLFFFGTKKEGPKFFLVHFFLQKKSGFQQKYDSGVFLRKSHSHSILTV